MPAELGEVAEAAALGSAIEVRVGRAVALPISLIAYKDSGLLVAHHFSTWAEVREMADTAKRPKVGILPQSCNQIYLDRNC